MNRLLDVIKIFSLLSCRRGVKLPSDPSGFIDQKIRELTLEKGQPDLLVVDYIGNMTVRNASQNAKDWENQSAAVKGLFLLAKRYNIPVLTAQQINRETIRESRKSKEANLPPSSFANCVTIAQPLFESSDKQLTITT